jgi:hypothetical protein
MKYHTLKSINHKIFLNNFKDNDALQKDRCLLERLYSLHFIAFELAELDEKVRDRILKVIKREQVKLEQKKYRIKSF